MSTKRYGNSNYWCFIEDKWDTSRPIEIWQTLDQGANEEIMAHATDRYNAQQLVDALITADNMRQDPENKLSKKEIVFLSFVESQCPEPWSTMAGNAILWNDRDGYTNLKAKFSEIY